jgi:hypothetical protein
LEVPRCPLMTHSHSSRLFIATGNCSTYVSYVPVKNDPKNRPDETPKSFAPEDWADAIARGGYWCALGGGWWVPVRVVSEEEFWESQPKGVRRRHGKLKD